MNKQQNRQFDPNILAVLHRTGRVWRSVIARMPSNGRSAGKPRLLAHREFSAAETNRIDGWLDQHDAGQVVCVLHASSVICRTCPLPDAPVDQLGPALRLQAEAHLFGIAPPHRLGMAVLDAAPGETSRSGIVLAWPGSSAAELPPVDREVRFAPDIAALACLLNGHRPTQPLAWVDREDGSLALAISHSSGAVFRGLREDASDIEAWKAAVGRVLAETCLSVGHTAAFSESLVSTAQHRIAQIPAGAAQMLAPPEILEGAKQRIENAPGDEEWWNAFGIAAGIVLARASELAPLTELRESAPVEKPSPLTAVVNTLSSRKTAAIAVAACIGLLMFGSLFFQGARLLLLKIKHPEQTLRTQLAELGTVRNRLVLYEELDNSAWSMTKILSDIVSNTPEGIELESINIPQMRRFTVQGRVFPLDGRTAPELVGRMRQQLHDSGVFHETTLRWHEPDSYGNYQFQLTARLRRPFLRTEYKGELAWDEVPYADRIRGIRPWLSDEEDDLLARADDTIDDPDVVVDEFVETALRGEFPDLNEQDDLAAMRADAGENGDEYEDGSASRSGPRAPINPFARGDRPGGSAASIVSRDQDVSSAEHNIPPELAESDIAVMSRSEALDVLRRVAEARQWTKGREEHKEVHERLVRESAALMARLRSLEQ